MARKPRGGSFTGYYHIIVRGVGKQILFEDERDFSFYLTILEKYSTETKVSVCAYCMMENHVHLLVCGEKDDLALLMKKTGVCYAAHYNRKYERTGHLFQDRYMSEPVESKNYLLTVFRYILNNPVVAGICPASEYLWSSYRRYGDKDSFVDTALLKGWIGGWEKYAEFIAEKNCDRCMEYVTEKKDDEWAKREIQAILGMESGTLLKSYGKHERDEAIRKLKHAGLSGRQIERLTGIGRGIIQRL